MHLLEQAVGGYTFLGVSAGIGSPGMFFKLSHGVCAKLNVLGWQQNGFFVGGGPITGVEGQASFSVWIYTLNGKLLD